MILFSPVKTPSEPESLSVSEGQYSSIFAATSLSLTDPYLMPIAPGRDPLLVQLSQSKSTHFDLGCRSASPY